MDYRPLLPAPLMKVAHIAPYDPIIRNYIGMDTDLTGGESVVYYATILNFDTVPAVMLPYLAKMFGVDGYKGFDYAPTEALKRQTLKNAMLMKIRHGTKWAIKTALENAGFQYVQIHDQLHKQYWNGAHLADGSITAYSYHWAMFKIQMEPPIGMLAIDVDVPRLMILINYWKRACTLCIDVQIDNLVITSFGIGDNPFFLWDGSEVADGSRLAGEL